MCHLCLLGHCFALDSEAADSTTEVKVHNGVKVHTTGWLQASKISLSVRIKKVKWLKIPGMIPQCLFTLAKSNYILLEGFSHAVNKLFFISCLIGRRSSQACRSSGAECPPFVNNAEGWWNFNFQLGCICSNYLVCISPPLMVRSPFHRAN